jgi:uncharacterized membrane protein (DUF2068 family)
MHGAARVQRAELTMAATTHNALRAIAVFKLCKALGLLVVAVASFDLVRSAQLDTFAEWIEQLPIHHGHRLLTHLLDAMLQLGPHKFIAIGLGACVYASLFLVEGWGLWRGRRWAEYLTTIATTSLIPFELYEIARHTTLLKVGALALNVAIVGYLIWLLQREAPHDR